MEKLGKGLAKCLVRVKPRTKLWYILAGVYRLSGRLQRVHHYRNESSVLESLLHTSGGLIKRGAPMRGAPPRTALAPHWIQWLCTWFNASATTVESLRPGGHVVNDVIPLTSVSRLLCSIINRVIPRSEQSSWDTFPPLLILDLPLCRFAPQCPVFCWNTSGKIFKRTPSGCCYSGRSASPSDATERIQNEFKHDDILNVILTPDKCQQVAQLSQRDWAAG